MLPEGVIITQTAPNVLTFRLDDNGLSIAPDKKKIIDAVFTWMDNNKFPRDQISVKPAAWYVNVYSDNPNIIMLMRLSF